MDEYWPDYAALLNIAPRVLETLTVREFDQGVAAIDGMRRKMREAGDGG